VTFDSVLRAETEHAAQRAHALFATGRTPAAVYERKCDQCSLMDLCMPKVAAHGKSARRYLQTMLDLHRDDGP